MSWEIRVEDQAVSQPTEEQTLDTEEIPSVAAVTSGEGEKELDLDDEQTTITRLLDVCFSQSIHV